MTFPGPGSNIIKPLRDILKVEGNLSGGSVIINCFVSEEEPLGLYGKV